MKRHVVLVGLPGSGKTTAGQLAARALGATFADVDAIIERREGQAVTKIFEARGEAAFRALERNEVETLLKASPAVVSAGGGWAAQAGSLESLRGRALAIYLETTPDVAAARVGSKGDRPLLAGGDPKQAMQALFDARRRRYEMAEVCVSTDDRTPEEVATEVVALARSAGGW